MLCEVTPSPCLSRGWTAEARNPKEASRISSTLSFMALVERTGRAVNSRALPGSDSLSETSLEAAARMQDPGFSGGSVVKNLWETRVPSLVWEDLTCHGATESVCLEPVLHNKRSYHNEKPAHCN